MAAIALIPQPNHTTAVGFCPVRGDTVPKAPVAELSPDEKGA